MSKIKITVEYDEGGKAEYLVPEGMTMDDMTAVLASMLIFLGYQESTVLRYINKYGEVYRDEG